MDVTVPETRKSSTPPQFFARRTTHEDHPPA